MFASFFFNMLYTNIAIIGIIPFLLLQFSDEGNILLMPTAFQNLHLSAVEFFMAFEVKSQDIFPGLSRYFYFGIMGAASM